VCAGVWVCVAVAVGVSVGVCVNVGDGQFEAAARPGTGSCEYSER
jgi:hypothetical protein